MKAFEVIGRRREERGIPVAELARRVDMPYESLRVALDGNRRITADELVELCTELGLELKDFA